MAKLCCWSLGINISLQLYRPTGLLTLEDLYVASHTSFLEKNWFDKESPDVKNYKWRLNPVWRRMLYYGCTQMATVGNKGL